MKTILILLVFVVLAIFGAEADSYASASSVSSGVAVAGEIEDIMKYSPDPSVITSTATTTQSTGGSTSVANAISEAVIITSTGNVKEDTSQSSSTSVNGKDTNGTNGSLSADDKSAVEKTKEEEEIIKKIKEEIEEMQMSI